MKTETIDLIGIDLPSQMKKVQALINDPANLSSFIIKTEHETIMKFIVPLAAQAGMQCVFAPPKDSIWEITIKTKQ